MMVYTKVIPLKSQKIYVHVDGPYLRRNDFVRYSRRGKFALLKDS